MANSATLPAAPPNVAKALAACPAAARKALDALRTLILETAAELDGVGPLTETLKWGEPAYLTEKPRTGTTIRLGWDATGETVSLYVHCQTTLIKAWRDLYENDLTFIGNRELRLSTDQTLPNAALKHCIAMALTYHSRKTRR
ncbi:MAG: DUF1801 domain-containing protein [Pseudomonadota bacterium]